MSLLLPRWRVSRRAFLQQTAAASALALARCGGGGECASPSQSKSPPTEWLAGARVAGLEAFAGIGSCDIKLALDRMAADEVSVVEIDGELSDYLDEQGFQAQLDLIQLTSEAAHDRGMRTVVYYPTLEVLTGNADKRQSTMFRDHPDWAQVYFDGRPAVFIGNVVFWVEPGTESCWMCPNTPYADYFIGRVERLAKTAADGFWGDVPLLADLAGVWSCVCPTCKARFLKETGHPIPTRVDWEDPVFRRWCTWRHKMIWEFEQSILTRAHKARSDFAVLIETVSMDYSSATLQALDAASAESGDVLRVWEVDCVSDTTAMRDASASDWLSMVMMMKHGRGCSGTRPSWVFCYGLETGDAERVMSIAIATGNSPYETKIPYMNKTVDNGYRRRLFGWIRRHPEVYEASPAHEAALVYSSPSRDFVDRNGGDGLYDSMKESDPQWWSDDARELAHLLFYLPDYRGCGQLLIREHVPFDVRIAPQLRAGALSGYRLVVVPSLSAVPTQTVDVLEDYVKQGGRLLLTGPDLGLYDEDGAKRAAPLVLSRFGLTATTEAWVAKAVGQGQVLYAKDRVGRSYFTAPDAKIATAFRDKTSDLPRQIVTDAPPAVLMELRRGEKKVHLLCVNLVGLGENKAKLFDPRDVTFSVSVELGSDTPRRVVLSRPDAGKEDKDEEIKLERDGTRARFQVSLSALALATIELG